MRSSRSPPAVLPRNRAAGALLPAPARYRAPAAYPDSEPLPTSDSPSATYSYLPSKFGQLGGGGFSSASGYYSPVGNRSASGYYSPASRRPLRKERAAEYSLERAGAR